MPLLSEAVEVFTDNNIFRTVAQYDSIKNSNSNTYRWETTNKDLSAFFGDKGENLDDTHRFAIQKNNSKFDLRLIDSIGGCPENADGCSQQDTRNKLQETNSVVDLSATTPEIKKLKQQLEQLHKDNVLGVQAEKIVKSARLIETTERDQVTFTESKLISGDFQDTQINYEIVTRGVKQSITLPSSSLQDRSMEFLLSLENLRVIKTAENSYILVDQEQKTVIQISQPRVITSLGNNANGESVNNQITTLDITQDPRGIIISISIDSSLASSLKSSSSLIIENLFVISSSNDPRATEANKIIDSARASDIAPLDITSGTNGTYLFQQLNSSFQVGFGARGTDPNTIGKTKLAYADVGNGGVGIEMQLLDEKRDAGIKLNTTLESEETISKEVNMLLGNKVIAENDPITQSPSNQNSSTLVDKIEATEVKSGVDIEYKVFPKGVKEDIVVKNRPIDEDEIQQKSKYEYALNAVGVTPQFVDGQWKFFSIEDTRNKLQDTNNDQLPITNNQESLFSFAKPFAIDGSGLRGDVAIDIEPWDKCGDYVKSGKLPTQSEVAQKQFEELTDCYKVVVTVDPEWLAADERQFPVKIDPTIVDDTSSEFSINDTAQSASQNRVIDTNSLVVTKSTYTSATTGTTFAVPAGVTKITVKAWGAGGGPGDIVGGNAGASHGGGGGFSKTDLTVTPTENLTVRVGGGGAANSGTAGGGGGGGYSGVFRSSTPLIIAGGGGGGTDCSGNGGGGGGGTTGQDGQAGAGASFDGKGGTQSAGGAGGSGTNAGSAGSSLQGGNAGQGSPNTGGAGGTNGGGAGGGQSGTFSGGGGGGGGYFGGGGGNGGSGGCPVGGGGGGSGYVSGSNSVTTMATSRTAANITDPDASATAGLGGDANTGAAGSAGRVVISYVTTDTTPVLETTYQEMPADINTVGLWHMNEGNTGKCTGGSNSICNSGTLGSAADGAINGSAVYSTSSKLGPSALEFDGTNDYISVADNTAWAFGTNDFTISFWLNFDIVGNTILMIQRVDANNRWHILYESNNLYFQDRDGGALDIDIGNFNPGFVAGNWYHVALTSHGTTFTFYINGVAYDIDTSSGTVGDKAAPLLIGWDAVTAGYEMDGRMDEVMVASRALSPEEIKLSAQRRPYATYTSNVFDLTSQMSSFGNLTWTEAGVSTGNGETLSDSTSLLAQWNFTNQSGATISKDAGSCSTTTCDLAVTGATTSGEDAAALDGWTENNKRWGTSAFMFDGTDARAACTDANCGGTSKLDIGTGGFSVAAWVKTSAGGTYACVVCKSASGADLSYRLNINNTPNKAAFQILTTGAGDYGSATSKSNVNDGQWHFIVGTWDGTNTLKLYFDGVLEATTVGSGTPNLDTAGDFAIGRDGSLNQGYFRGVIDTVYVIDRAMTQNEIISNYNHTNIEFQTRTGADNTPNDGSWEAWKPTTGEATIDSMDTGTGWNSTQANMANLQAVDYGDGADGAITVSSNTNLNTTSLIGGRSCADGGDMVNYSSTANTSFGATSITLSSTPSSGCLAVGDEILIISLQGNTTISNYRQAGNWETHTISAISTATLYFNDYALKNSYDGTTQKIMVQRVPNYTNVTINASQSLTASDWNGTKGGVIFFRANGTVTNNGTIDANALGYRGGTNPGSGDANAGESTSGQDVSLTGNQVGNPVKPEAGGGGGNGGGANAGGGGGGGYGTSGNEGINCIGTGNGAGGPIIGDASLIGRMLLGSGGGAGSNTSAATGGDGGGIIGIFANTLTNSGTIRSNGGTGGNTGACNQGGGGGGSGGSILIKAYTFTQSSTFTANGGAGGTGSVGTGGTGGSGRIAIYYVSSLTGTTSPTAYTQRYNFATEGSGSLKTTLGAPQVDTTTTALWRMDETNSSGPIYDSNGYRSFATDSTGNLESNLISYWRLDEGTNDTCVGAVNDVCDGVSKNDGTNNGASVVSGKLGNALDFNGSSHTITIGDPIILDINDTDDLTISGWFNRDTSNTDDTVIAKRHGQTAGSIGYSVYIDDTDDKLYFEVSDGTDEYSLASTSTFTSTGWNHFVAVWDQDSAANTEIYINGSDDNATDTGTIGNVGTTSSSATFAIGDEGDGGAPFDGKLDEFGIWNRAITSTSEISDLYNSGNANALTSMSSNNGSKSGTTAPITTDGYLGKGLDFDGTDDYLTIPAISLNTGSITVSGWFLRETSGETNVFWNDLGSEVYGMRIGQTSVRCSVRDSGGDFLDNNPVTTVIGWTHVACVYDAANTNVKVYVNGTLVQSTTNALTNFAQAGASFSIIGAGNGPASPYFNGKMDELKISNVARSYEEIHEEYRAGRDHRIGKAISSTDLCTISGSTCTKTSLPFYIAADRPGTYLEATVGESAYANWEPDTNTVLLLRLEESNGTGAYLKDSSGYNNNATPTGTTSVQGRFGKGRNFGGTSADYLTITDSTSLDATTFTVEMWIKFNAVSYANNKVLLWKGDTGGNAHTSPYFFNFNTNNKLDFWIGNGSGSFNTASGATALVANQWYHIVGTADGSNVRLYVNGALDGTTSQTITPVQNANNLSIDGIVPGQTIYNTNSVKDDIRILNTARTADEIRQAFEVGKRTHPITIDFVSSPQAAYTSGTSMTINNMSGQTNLSDSLKVGDTIIVQENVGGVEYRSTGTVTVIANTSSVYGTITLASALSGLPSGGYSTAAKIFKWQREYFDLSGITLRGTHDNAITRLTLRVTDASQGANIWLDDIKSNTNYLSTASGSTVTSTVARYYQYRAIFTSGDPAVSANLTAVTQNYITGPTVNQLMKHGLWFSSGTKMPFWYAEQ